MAKVSVKAAARDAVRAESKMRGVPSDATRVASHDSFVNFAQKLGIGADNSLSTASYGFNPITRQRTLLEWIHRGSWLGGVAVDVVADDMTRQGIEYVTEMPPEQTELIDASAQRLNIWDKTNECIKWSRLYGGCIAVLLVDGQDFRTPLNLDAIAEKSFRGLLVLDRWMVDPSLEDLVTDLGPYLGMPKFYRVGSNAPALRGMVIHYSRLAFRLEGIQLPYNQRLTENLWGISVIERLYDRMVAYDTASTGAAQLVGKAYLRTLKIKGMREVVSSGGPALEGLVKYTEMMRRFQGIEGITMVDGEDEFETDAHGAFSGLDDALMQFAQQLSGALQIPLTRLFGQSPAGLNATGDNDMRNYYDHIRQRQMSDLHDGIVKTYKLIAWSEAITLPENFAINFKSLWQLTETDKATIAKTTTDAILAAHEGSLISDKTALQELRESSNITGVFTNITAELIEAADEEIADPMEGMIDPDTGLPVDEDGDPKAPPFGGAPGSAPGAPGDPDGGPPPQAGSTKEKTDGGPEVRPQEKEGAVGKSPTSRRKVQLPPAAGR